jgi:CRP-like cAMP-binding protein/L-ascorbate metabolism protein UlaG (beta-lactamase superfamily)
MANPKECSIYKGYNFRVLEIKGFDPICFGCPPGIVKDFNRRSKALPSKYVLPIRTFVQGINNFDFEFIVYTFLFNRSNRGKITIYCTADQRNRLKSILQETLFGPDFRNLIHAQFYRFSQESGFTDTELKRYKKFLDHVAESKKPLDLYNRFLKYNTSDRQIQSEMRGYFETLIRGKQWLMNKAHSRTASLFAQNYITCAQLKKEMDLFSLAKEKNQNEFIGSLIDFQIFNKQNAVTIEDAGKQGKTLKIVQARPAEFDIHQQGRRKFPVNMLKLDLPPKLEVVMPLEKPFMGVTYLGVGSGFSHNRKNSCLIIWSEGKGIMVDAFSEHHESALKYGITDNDINYIILSHVHSDHDSGLIEKILSGQRIKLITTRIIFESFLRKVQGISRFPKKVIEGFVDLLEVEAGNEIKLPGFKNTYLLFDYSFHSIPAGRFKVTYRPPGGSEKTISHSGDTKYDEDLTYRWWKMGSFSRKRRDSILGFVWDADLIIQEVGGGNLHTELASLAHLDSSLAKKVVLIHQHKEPFKHPYFRFAHEGETDVLIKSRKSKVRTKLNLIKDMVLFKGVKKTQLAKIVEQSKIQKLKPGAIVFSKNEIGNEFFVILDGFAEIAINKNQSVVYERGMFFGELAVATSNPRRRATVKALSDLTLLKIPKKLYTQSSLPKIIDEFYQLGNYFNSIIRPGLIASLGFGDLRHWKKRDSIFAKDLNRDLVFIIISGEVKICPQGTKNIAFLSSGDIMGQIPDWKHVPLTDRAIAHTDQVLAVGISTRELDQLFRLYPSFYGTVFKKMKRLESILC